MARPEDQAFARLSQWCRTVGVTWHTPKKGSDVLKSKRTGEMVRKV